jgi:hypothetical protein
MRQQSDTLRRRWECDRKAMRREGAEKTLGMWKESDAPGKQHAQTQTREKHYATAMRWEVHTLEAAVGKLVAQKQEHSQAVARQARQARQDEAR